MNTKWDFRFGELSAMIATWSKDPSTKVGAVIANDHDHKVRGIGYNGFPRGVEDTNERYAHRPTKYKLVVHAEVNAILNADGSVAGCTLYTTKFPCSECAKLIIQSGITEIVFGSEDARWAEDAESSRLMFNEAGVVYRQGVIK